MRGLLSTASTLALLLALAAPATAENCVSGSWRVVSGTPDEAPVRYQTDHFAFRWKADAVSETDAASAGKQLEFIWSVFMTKVQFAEPFCDTADKHKANVNIDPTFGLTGGPTGDRDMGMWIGPLALKDHWGLAHEFTHALQGSTRGLRGDKYAGWMWESHANWMAHQMPEYRDELHCSEMLVNAPHLYYGSSRDRYCNWQFFDYLKDVYGYKAVNDVWTKSKKMGEPGYEEDEPFTILMRNQGWTLQQLNDVIGAWAAHNVGWDYRDPDGYASGLVYRARYGNYDDRSGDRIWRVTDLDPIDRTKRQFHVPDYAAPQRWGYNLVRLIPDAGATTITIAFRGVVQTTPAVSHFDGAEHEPARISPPGSDWRWAVVAIDAAGNSRYGDMIRGSRGEQTFTLKPGDQAIFLMVMATPNVMQKIEWDQPFYSIYRYPWMIGLQNAQPAGYEADAPTPTPHGHRHANGGGWVADGAHVDDTAYVGPMARVLGGKVLDHARIEDHAVVLGGTVSGRARVGALSVINGNVLVTDDTVILSTFKGPGAFEPGAVISGTAQLIGDTELRDGLHLSRGVYYGFVDRENSTKPKEGAARTRPVPEVTAKPDFSWQNTPGP